MRVPTPISTGGSSCSDFILFGMKAMEGGKMLELSQDLVSYPVISLTPGLADMGQHPWAGMQSTGLLPEIPILLATASYSFFPLKWIALDAFEAGHSSARRQNFFSSNRNDRRKKVSQRTAENSMKQHMSRVTKASGDNQHLQGASWRLPYVLCLFPLTIWVSALAVVISALIIVMHFLLKKMSGWWVRGETEIRIPSCLPFSVY